ncbi:MAG: hypothetical protein ACRDNZ_02860 [Streptosporangiaceae bacterium]
MPPLKLMTTAETADYITRLGARTSARTLEDWRQKGTGPDYFRVEGRVFYSPGGVRRWLAQKEQKAAAGTAA